MAKRGYCGIAVYHPKTETNVGTLWRSANVFGASFLALIGRRFKKQASDTMATHRNVPLYEYLTFDQFRDHQPHGCAIVAVERCATARNIVNYCHPERAVYLLGPEDGGIPSSVLARCHSRIVIPGTHCLNVAAAGSIVLYDRMAKLARPAQSVPRRDDPEVEEEAERIYSAMREEDPAGSRYAWVPGGNSLKQDEARRLARVGLALQVKVGR